jgi:hypothetical protein
MRRRRNSGIGVQGPFHKASTISVPMRAHAPHDDWSGLVVPGAGILQGMLAAFASVEDNRKANGASQEGIHGQSDHTRNC